MLEDGTQNIILQRLQDQGYHGTLVKEIYLYNFLIYQGRHRFGPKFSMLYGCSQHILRSVTLLTNICKHVYTYLYRAHFGKSGTCHKK